MEQIELSQPIQPDQVKELNEPIEVDEKELKKERRNVANAVFAEVMQGLAYKKEYDVDAIRTYSLEHFPGAGATADCANCSKQIENIAELGVFCLSCVISKIKEAQKKPEIDVPRDADNHRLHTPNALLKVTRVPEGYQQIPYTSTTTVVGFNVNNTFSTPQNKVYDLKIAGYDCKAAFITPYKHWLPDPVTKTRPLVRIELNTPFWVKKDTVAQAGNYDVAFKNAYSICTNAIIGKRCASFYKYDTRLPKVEPQSVWDLVNQPFIVEASIQHTHAYAEITLSKQCRACRLRGDEKSKSDMRFTSFHFVNKQPVKTKPTPVAQSMPPRSSYQRVQPVSSIPLVDTRTWVQQPIQQPTPKPISQPIPSFVPKQQQQSNEITELKHQLHQEKLKRLGAESELSAARKQIEELTWQLEHPPQQPLQTPHIW
jgi:hypothetical protein